MAIKKWGQLTPRQIGHLDKDKTIVVLPLGTMGSFDDQTRVWADLQVVEDDAKGVAETITNVGGPFAGFGAVLLSALWTGVEPGPDQPGTIALSLEVFGCVVKSICFSLRKQGIKYVVLVARDDDVFLAAQSLETRLNQAEPPSWVAAYNPMLKSPLHSIPGDICRAVCEKLGFDSSFCPQ